MVEDEFAALLKSHDDAMQNLKHELGLAREKSAKDLLDAEEKRASDINDLTQQANAEITKWQQLAKAFEARWQAQNGYVIALENQSVGDVRAALIAFRDAETRVQIESLNAKLNASGAAS